jgi:hypothetical protein
MTTPGETAMDRQMVPEDDQVMPGKLMSDPAGAVAAGDPHAPAAAVNPAPKPRAALPRASPAGQMLRAH